MNFIVFRILLLFVFINAANAQSMPSQRAENVQVLDQYSTLIANCRTIGPLSFRHKLTVISSLIGKGRQDTVDKAKERALEMRGDTLVITSMQEESLGAVWRLQGVVMSCFNVKSGVHEQNKSELIPDNNMSCQTDLDCEKGFSCRSRKGGGAECRAIKD
jgi:hypothetical protein